MWFVYAITTLIFWALADLFYKKGADEKDKYSPSGLFLFGCNSLPFLARLARMQQEAGVLLFRVVLFHWAFHPDSSVLTP